MKKLNKKAFTLVELLVVIAILAILATAAIIGYSVFTERAHNSVAQSELAQFVRLMDAELLDGQQHEFSKTGKEGYGFKLQLVNDGVVVTDVEPTSPEDDTIELKDELANWAKASTEFEGTFVFTLSEDKFNLVTYAKNSGNAYWDLSGTSGFRASVVAGTKTNA